MSLRFFPHSWPAEATSPENGNRNIGKHGYHYVTIRFSSQVGHTIFGDDNIP